MAEIIDSNNVEKAKRLIKESKEKLIALAAKDDKFNRKMIEYGKFDIISGIEFGERKNSLKQADSGINHYLAKTAEKNKVAFGIDISRLRDLNAKEKAIIIEKVIQNIKICRKNNAKLKIINPKDEKDAFSFFVSLGASNKQAKEAI